jgi:hypothetical protein
MSTVNSAIASMRDIPTHVWMILVCLALLIAYYIRPDPVTQDLLKSFSGALLLSLRAGVDQRPPGSTQTP